MCYNFSVKVKKFATITSIIAACTMLFGGGTAYADGEQTVYPEIFTENAYDAVDSLTDFAVGKDCVSLAYGNTVSIVGSDGKTDYDAGSAVTALDCTESDGSTLFFYTDAGGTTRSLPDREPYDGKVQSYENIDVDGYYYYYDNDALVVFIKNTREAIDLDGCTRLKKYADKLYVIKDNKVCLLEGDKTQVIALEYTDYKSAAQIFIGDTAENIKSGGATFVRLAQDSYKTEVDLNELGGKFFKTAGTERAKSGETALLLCYTGNAAVIAVGEKTYITLKTSVEEIARSAETAPEFERATVCVPFDYIYSSPAMCDGTKIRRIDWGESVKVLGKLSCSYSTELAGDFYRVSIEAGETEPAATGYVPCSFLAEQKIADIKPNPIEDENKTNEDLTRTVTLVVLVIALSLIALGYITYVGTSGKGGKSDKKGKNKKPPHGDAID